MPPAPARSLLHGIAALAAAALGCGTLLLAGCAREAPAHPAPRAVEVGVVTLHSRRLALTTELPGRTSASLIADVRPQVSGIVKSRLFREGSEVNAGQVLYEIDPTVYQAAVDQARADLASAEATATAAKLKTERYAALVTTQVVAKQDADDVRAAYLQAAAGVEEKKAALESARINLEHTHVRAPISGHIGKSNVTPGALVTANQDSALATIRVLDPIYVDLVQSSSQLLALRKLLDTAGMRSGGTTVHLKLEDGSRYGLPGRLEFREVSVDQATGSITLRARFPNPHGILLPGMYVRAVIDEAVDRSALLAPQQGITRDPRGNALAMVVDGQDRIEQ
ncbi:MAG: efflux RND transporter periplasmic adaptor subunit, partial [Steroidobacteraceae bacterium]